jgi:AraC-like DNA-binding protein
MDRAYAEPLDLETIASAAGVSPYHFLRAFTAAYGETPGRYLTRRRVERAKTLLRSVNLTVTEICHLVGFSSVGTFSARFKQVVGVSPSAYRAATIEAGGPPPVPGCFVMMWTRPPHAAQLRSQPSRNPGEAAPDPPSVASVSSRSTDR